MRNSEKVIVNFTPTGMIPTKKMTPHVPISVEEIVEDVHRATEIGITIVHLHAREDLTAKPTNSSDMYGRIVEGIRAFDKELVLGVSLSGRTIRKFEKRAEPLLLEGDLKPDMGSLTLSSLNFNRAASMNEPEMIVALATEMKKRGILPELEAFDTGMVNFAKYLLRKDLLQAPHYFNLLLGNIACAQADLLHAGIMIRDLPDDSFWALAGIGDVQLNMNIVAIAMGGGVRIGLEDNIYFDQGRTRLATNSDLLKRVHGIAESCERKIMTPAECRKALRLEPGNGKYGRVYG